MSKNRRNFTPQQKADIVRRHLKDKVPVSTLAEELSIQPTQIYQWVAMVLEQAVRPQNKLHPSSTRGYNERTCTEDRATLRSDPSADARVEVRSGWPEMTIHFASNFNPNALNLTPQDSIKVSAVCFFVR